MLRLADAGEKSSERGLHMTDSVRERHQLEAIRKRTNASASAGDVHERDLPRPRIEQDA